MPLLSTSTDVMLSHSNVMRLPRNLGAHRTRATNTVTNSKALICNCSAFKASGNGAWKKRPRNQPPQPSRQASVDNNSSGSVQGDSGIIDTPLYFTRKRLHHSRSALVPSGIAMKPVAGVSLNSASKRIVNTRPGRTQAATKFSLPSRLWSSFLEHRGRASHQSKRSLISLSLSSSMERVNCTESNRMPRKVMLTQGGTRFSTESPSPALARVSPKAA